MCHVKSASWNIQFRVTDPNYNKINPKTIFVFALNGGNFTVKKPEYGEFLYFYEKISYMRYFDWPGQNQFMSSSKTIFNLDGWKSK